MSLGIKLIYASFCLATLIVASESARVLGFFPTPSKSHLIIHSAVASALAERGHDVTVVSTHKSVQENPPYRYIQLNVPGFSHNEFSKSMAKPLPWYQKMNSNMQIWNNYANISLNQPEMQELMANESFDMVILGYFYNQFLLGVGAHFKCPIVMSFMIRPNPSLSELVGNPDEAAYVPSILIQTDQPLGFFDRVRNFISINLLEKFLLKRLLMSYQSELYNKNFPADKYPPFEDMLKNVSLVLTNHHFSQGLVRPYVPALVEIGGIQIKNEPDPLPEDIKSILDNSSEHGVVFFSLGTTIEGNTLEPAKLQAIFNALSKLKETILWKWSDSKLPGKSPNIVYKSWVPQNDVLAHQNVKLFITHGGQGSVVESSFHGVPMVGIPIYADQKSNMESVTKQGFGLLVDFHTLQEEELSRTINEVLSDKKYTEKVQKFARVYKDRPMTAKETAVFWMEYVLRHHGAIHMQSPAVHMNFFQLKSLDVIGFLAACIYLVYRAIKFIILFVKSKLWDARKIKAE
ncbi:UDP-glycosyltransferase UGT5-like [Episyrphus balteatus]|uniref:UDP-glycosyltransferase UGT5-like n=1 Tax=Episyrphus balteatus TaxID=286459 RepID=UPI00248564C1|nr:UDP-glycosyltransferase UGT5-like [Episyrphus balteatus]